MRTSVCSHVRAISRFSLESLAQIVTQLIITPKLTRYMTLRKTDERNYVAHEHLANFRSE